MLIALYKLGEDKAAGSSTYPCILCLYRIEGLPHTYTVFMETWHNASRSAA